VSELAVLQSGSWAADSIGRGGMLADDDDLPVVLPFQLLGGFGGLLPNSQSGTRLRGARPPGAAGSPTRAPDTVVLSESLTLSGVLVPR
jgi:hypothetical protein